MMPAFEIYFIGINVLTFLIYGADKKGEVKALPAYNEAYELGKSIK